MGSANPGAARLSLAAVVDGAKNMAKLYWAVLLPAVDVPPAEINVVDELLKLTLPCANDAETAPTSAIVITSFFMCCFVVAFELLTIRFPLRIQDLLPIECTNIVAVEEAFADIQ